MTGVQTCALPISRIQAALERLASRIARSKKRVDAAKVNRQIGCILQQNQRAAARFAVSLKNDDSAAGFHLHVGHNVAFDDWAELSEGAYLLRSNVQWQLQNRPHPEQGYRACLGLLNLAKRYGESRLEAACCRALAIGSPTRKRIVSILDAKLDQHPELFPTAAPCAPPKAFHANLRGPEYFRSTTDKGEPEPCLSNPPSIH